MSGFWAPYQDFPEALAKVGCFADKTIGPACGISYSDGTNIALLRKPASQTDAQWLNVMTHHVAVPGTPPAVAATTRWEKVERWMAGVLSKVGEAEYASSQAQLAVGTAEAEFIHDQVWLPTHKFLLRHKKLADAAGVALDVVGVIAGAAFVVAAFPEVLGTAAIIGTTGLITGGLATAGSSILLVTDGLVLAAELSGHEKFQQETEDNPAVAWMRVAATVMLFTDLPVGGVRALREIVKLTSEAREFREMSATADELAETQRLRQTAIRNPQRHASAVQRRQHRVSVLMGKAKDANMAAERAQARVRMLTLRDVNASFVATPGSGGLLAGMPPEVLMSKKQIKADENYLEDLRSEQAMQRDLKLEFRVIGTAVRSASK